MNYTQRNSKSKWRG